MARIAGVDLPPSKRVEIGLTYIYGIGRTRAAADPGEGQGRSDDQGPGPDRRRGHAHPARDQPGRPGRGRPAQGDLAEHQAADGDRLLPRACGTAATCRCADSGRTPTRGPDGPAPRRRRQEAEDRQEGLIRGRTRWPKAKASGGKQGRQEGKEERPARRGPHPGDVQQHDHHDHRPDGQRDLPGPRRAARASRARARARRSPRRPRRRTRPTRRATTACARVDVRVKGPGAGRESAIRALQAAGHRDQVDQGRHADPAQRLPAAEAAAGLSEAGGSNVARHTGPVCRLCRREGMKLFLKGDRCFTDKCAFERRGYAPGQHGRRRTQDPGLRHPAAREAEGQADVRRAGAAVPQLLRQGGPSPRASPATTCCSCSSAGWTTSSTGWASPRRARWPASSSATATSR